MYAGLVICSKGGLHIKNIAIKNQCDSEKQKSVEAYIVNKDKAKFQKD